MSVQRASSLRRTPNMSLLKRYDRLTNFRLVSTPESVVVERPVSFELVHRDAELMLDTVRPFGSQEAADGHRVWIQLALLEGIAALRDVASHLNGLGGQALWQVDDFDDAVENLQAAESRLEERQGADPDTEDDDDADLVDAEWDVERARQEVEDARASVSAALATFATAIDDFREAAQTGATAHGLTATVSRGALRVPLYLIDEPERHLHPRIQRHLASWMSDLMRVHGSQGLIVTHSVPFVNQADVLVYVERSGTRSNARACSRAELDDLGHIAQELGLDRGQLLAGVSIMLFVEGPSDQYVLESLFSNRLRSMGAIVVPLHGATQVAQLVDSQLLVRYCPAKIAVLFDGLDEETLTRLMGSRRQLEQTANSEKLEEREMGRLLLALSDQGRSATPLGLPYKDVLDVLDEEAIRIALPAPLSTKAVAFPAHRLAQNEYVVRRRKGESRKQFYQRRYGIPYRDVAWFKIAADNMHARGIRPQALTDIIDTLELLSLS